MEAPYGYVYRITHALNGKTYVGQRKLAKDVSWRQYLGSGVLVQAAVAEYGEDSFAKSFLGYAATKTELDALELTLIRAEREAGHGEYNLFLGAGAGGELRYEETAWEEAVAHRSQGLKAAFASGRATPWNKGLSAAADECMAAKAARAVARGTYVGLNKGSTRTEASKQLMSLKLQGNKNSLVMATPAKRLQSTLTKGG